MTRSFAAGTVFRHVSIPAVLAVLALTAGLDSAALSQPKADDAIASPQKVTQPSKAPPRCHGQNLLDKLKTTKPHLYRQIVEEGSRVANTNAVFWKITKPGTKPSYLFGTIHITDPRVTTFTDKVKAALADVDTIVLEIANLAPADLQRAMLAAMGQHPELFIYMDGARLDQKLSKREFAIASKALTRAGVPTQIAFRFRPLLVYMSMASPPCESARVRSGLQVLDSKLASYAKSHGIRVVGLETLVEQLSAMSSISDAEQLQLLKFTLGLADQRENMLETMITLYQSRRVGLMDKLSDALAEDRGYDPKAFDNFENALLTKRNYRMRDNSLELLTKGRAFIAVGALHLVGDNGLVALLRKAGYTVAPIE
jgi:uncharacterized protein